VPRSNRASRAHSTWRSPIGGCFKPNIATASAEAHRSYECQGAILRYFLK
jgi:hypothetical protein